MATLVLQTVGTVVGSFFGPIGAAIGSALGGLAGSAIDGALLSKPTRRSGPRLDNLQAMSSSEGAAIPRVYGSVRLSGQVIWATALEEDVSTKKVGSKGAKQIVTDYAYRANLAIGLCEGPISHVRRVWADGKPLALGRVTMRVHAGGENQAADPLILAKRGAAGAPAYRGLAYVVFEKLPLEAWGNRVPQFTFEVVKPVGGIESALRAITLIPGAGEFVYEDRIITATPRRGVTERVNRHMASESSDFLAALDELAALCPRLERVSLVVAWFGDDLRAGSCSIAPRVEVAGKQTSPAVWSVAGLSRGAARIVSTGADGRPAYGGTPSDESVRRAIAALKARGYAVTLYPFVMMDVPAGNLRADPWTSAASQPANPWRGRITVDPAPGRPGTPDGTLAAATQIQAFFGSTATWSYRRMVMHYAALAEAAGGVDAFVIGSELVGLTRIRSAPGVYPAVGELVAIAASARATLRAGTRIVYGADWTEYGAHVTGGGSEVRFPLDPLFAHPAIDAVALDWYAPLSDWRDGTTHRDAAIARAVHDPAYLAANIAGGEAFDWYYASDADRVAQLRTPITDGAYAKPWTFRQKDLIGWWQSPHKERVGGLELAGQPAWVPQMKPIWLLETGCPAVDKGSNQPSAFPDPASSEGTLPRFSDGGADDLVQARLIEAVLTHWDAGLPGHPAGANPVSTVYGGPMVDASRIYLWAFDARPYPAFPNAEAAWSDGRNWALGHWLWGRLGQPTLDHLVAAILADHGEGGDTAGLDGIVTGAVVDRPMSARDVIEPLAALFSFQGIDRAGTMTFRHAGSGPASDIPADDLVDREKQPRIARLRAQESELPRSVSVAFVDPEADFSAAVETSRRLDTTSRGEARIDAALALPRREAARRAEIVLQDGWIARDSAAFALPPSRIALEPGDLLRLDIDGRPRLHLATRVTDGAARAIEARRIEPAVFARTAPARRPAGFSPAAPDPRCDALLLDLPALPGAGEGLQWLAAAATPWPGALNLWRSSDGKSYALERAVTRAATIATLLEPLAPGPAGRWDRAGSLLVEVSGSGRFESASEAEVLDGANLLALRLPDGRFELLQFTRASLVAAGILRLSGLLRGQLGTEWSAATVAPGADLVLVDAALVPVATRPEEVGRALTWRVGPAELDAGDMAVVDVVGTVTATALKPYAPAHVTARRGAGGITLAWIRRSRIGGDGWEGEVPLGEAREAYEVEIMDGPAVRRVLAASSPTVLYAAAQEAADFGGPQASLSLRLYQLGDVAGRGHEKQVTINV